MSMPSCCSVWSTTPSASTARGFSRPANASLGIAWSNAPVTSTPPRPFAVNFAQIMTGLRAALAAAYGRPVLAGGGMDRPRRPLAPPLVLRLHRRLGTMMLAFAALVAHLSEFGADA